MLDAKKLLDQFLGTQATHHRHGSSSPWGGPGASRSGGSIEDQIGRALGGALGGGTHRRPSSASSALPAAIAGGLASYLLKGKRRRHYGYGYGSSAKLSGMALVAGLAYKAWQQYQAQNRTAATTAQPAPQGAGARTLEGTDIPAAEGTRFHPAGREEDSRAQLLLSAMIAAAKADGYIDSEEQEAIFGRIDDLDLDAETKGFVMDEMRKPISIDEIARRTPDQEAAVEVYLASLLAIDPDHPAEKAYLDMLAARLNLPGDLVAQIRRTADETQE